jgi:transcriptional regulator
MNEKNFQSYTTKYFKEENKPKLQSFIKKYNFGQLITINKENLPVSTHLPFLIHKDEGDLGYLYSHLAISNPVHYQFEKKNKRDGVETILITFNGPHGYISPNYYPGKSDVPTWNYSTVHVYGHPFVITEDELVNELFKELVNVEESKMFEENEKWDISNVNEEDLKIMKNKIVWIGIKIEKLEGKFKLSQNKDKNTIEKVIVSLKDVNKDLSNFMNENN